jgi:hypothetical protein
MPKRPPVDQPDSQHLLSWWYWGPKNMKNWWTYELDRLETEKIGLNDLGYGVCRRLYDGKEISIDKAKRLKLERKTK